MKHSKLLFVKVLLLASAATAQISCSYARGGISCCNFGLRETKSGLCISYVHSLLRFGLQHRDACFEQRPWCFAQSIEFNGPADRTELKHQITQYSLLTHDGAVIRYQWFNSNNAAAWRFKERADGSLEMHTEINGEWKQVGIDPARSNTLAFYSPGHQNTRSFWLEPTTCQDAGTYPARGSCVPCIANHYCLSRRAPIYCGSDATSSPGAKSYLGCKCRSGLVNNGVSCERCNRGQRCPQGSTLPALCPAGYFCSTPESITECGVGRYCPEGQAEPIQCPSNMITLKDTAESIAECVCKAGFTRQNGQCVSCAAGSFKSTSGNGQCTDCPEGRYCLTESIEPKACPSNMETLNTGASSANDCACQAGFEKAGVDCVPCSPGTFKAAAGDHRCTKCRAATICVSGATAEARCPEGFFCNEGTSWPLTCPVNTFCPAGSADPIPCNTEMNRHNPQIASKSVESCVCKPGSHLVDGECQMCPLNHFCAGDKAPAVACDEAAHLHIPFEGADAAEKCTCIPGYFQAEADCQSCSENHYCSGGVNAPIPCGANATAPQLASWAEECYCPPGMFGNGTVQCQTCPLGRYCPGNTVQEQLCPANRVTTTSGAKAVDQCVCAPGFQFSSNRCVVCPKSTYKKTAGNSMCSPAPKNAVTNTTHWVCPASMEPQAGECVECAPGTARAFPGTEPCSPCASIKIDCSDNSNPTNAELIDRCYSVACGSSASSQAISASIGASAGVLAAVVCGILYTRFRSKSSLRAQSSASLSGTRSVKPSSDSTKTMPHFTVRYSRLKLIGRCLLRNRRNRRQDRNRFKDLGRPRHLAHCHQCTAN